MEAKNYLQLIQEKIMDETRLQQQLKIWRMFGERIIFTNGCFDLLHQGHIALLTQAKDLGGKLIVGLNSDASVKLLKGENRPINDQVSRSLLLACIQIVDAVIIFNDETPLELIKKIVPDVLVKGGDYSANQIVGSEFVLENGGNVEIIPITQGFSSTNIIEKMS